MDGEKTRVYGVAKGHGWGGDLGGGGAMGLGWGGH